MFFDAHTDIINDVANKMFKERQNVFDEVHLKKLKKANIKGGIFNMWVEPQYYNKALSRLYSLMYIYKNCIVPNGDICTVKTAADMDKKDKFLIILGIEGMSAIEDNIAQLEFLYEFGVRHGMLTWNGANLLAAGAGASEFSGLSKKGKQAIKYMQRLGMIVDVSHLNEKSFYDAVNLICAPIIASHSNCKALCNNKRNLTDNQIMEIARVGGVIGVNSYGAFVAENENERTVKKLAEHILHITEVAGIDHVGCGFDFCDYLNHEPDPDAITTGFEDIQSTPNLIIELKSLGFSEEDIEKIAYKNFYRVIKQILK